jgi:hypothetical protein
VITVQMSTTGKNAKGDTLKRLSLAIDVAVATAEHIRNRAERGHFATVPKPYAGEPQAKNKRRRKYVISKAYAQAMGVQETKWASSAALHRAAGGTPGYTTGGMWKGMRVRNYGTEGAVIEFAGSSLGSRGSARKKTEAVKGEIVIDQRGSKVTVKQRRQYKRDEQGKVIVDAEKPTMTTNRLKASAVFQRLRIGLLQPTQSESDAQVAAICEMFGKATAIAFGAQDTMTLAGTAGVDPALLRSIRDKIR